MAEGSRVGADRPVTPPDRAARKRSRVRLLQRYVFNPWTKLAAWAGLAPGLVLVETTGRRSGKRRRNVVGMYVEGGTGWVVAEQGRHAGYVRNLEAHPDVRVRRRCRWHPARAHVVPDDDPRARLGRFRVPGQAAAVTRFGTDLLTIRFDFDREP
ncbi:MAG: nitroreductase/quinone reductase family protein [Acidimicrobiia bacterium]